MEIISGSFCWDESKEAENIRKHGIYFRVAARAFLDPNRAVIRDHGHSLAEERWFCIGRVDGEPMTVRFTYRGDKVRIIGAGYWRKWRRYYYEKGNF